MMVSSIHFRSMLVESFGNIQYISRWLASWHNNWHSSRRKLSKPWGWRNHTELFRKKSDVLLLQGNKVSDEDPQNGGGPEVQVSISNRKDWWGNSEQGYGVYIEMDEGMFGTCWCPSKVHYSKKPSTETLKYNL